MQKDANKIASVQSAVFNSVEKTGLEISHEINKWGIGERKSINCWGYEKQNVQWSCSDKWNFSPNWFCPKNRKNYSKLRPDMH